MEFKDMTNKECAKFFEAKIWELMQAELIGNTCTVNQNGELINYKCDLENAYYKVVKWRKYIWD